jgi:putative hemolysin
MRLTGAKTFSKHNLEVRKKMIRQLLTFILLIAALAACTAETSPDTTTLNDNEANLPNPASVYCEEQGYTVEMREGADGVYGVCIFPDGSECDEWAYFRGECAPGEGTALAEDGWQIYRNEAVGYTFHYPLDAVIEMGNDPLRTVTILGPLVEDEYWPVIYVSHPADREEYRPPEGVDLVEWLIDHNLLMVDEGQPTAETRRADVQIGGETAVHTWFAGSPQAYAYDKYLLAHDDQLYVIVILHAGDREDWTLYNHFLESFQFES